MKKIKITIPDNLTPSEEAVAISEKLNQKLLSGHGRTQDKLRLGNAVDIKELETQIIISRTGEKPIEFIKCNVCGCDYQNDLFKPVWVNYGGKVNCIKVCCESCQDYLISICGKGRAATKKSKLSPIRCY